MLWKTVRVNPNYEVSPAGDVRKVGNGQTVGQWLNSEGYATVRLSQPRRLHRVHQLVADAWVPNPRGLVSVNHINNIRSDNRAENLEWCTQRENLAHARRQGRMPQDGYWRGKRSPNAKLDVETVRAIRSAYVPRVVSLEQVAKRFGVSKRCVGRIVAREVYVDV